MRFPMLALLVGCNHEWAPIEGPLDKVAMERAHYACLKENTTYQESASIGRNGAQSTKGMKVNRSLADACMRAQGFTLVRPETTPSERVVTPTHPFLFGVGIVGGLGTGHQAVHNAQLGPGLEGVVGFQTNAGLKAGLMGGGDLALSYRFLPWLELGLTAGGRAVGRGSRFGSFVFSGPRDDDTSISNEYVEGELQFSGAPAFDGSLDVRIHAQPLPLFFVLGGGFQTLPGIPSTTGIAVATLETFDGESFVETQVGGAFETRSVVGRVIPVIQAGVGLDLIRAAPYGLRTRCVGRMALHSGVTAGDYRYPDRLGAECGLTFTAALGTGGTTP